MKNLISPHELANLRDVVVVDARFRLAEPSAAERLFREGHVPGARFADLARDLSGPKSARGGRHPLPSREALEALFSGWGVGPGTEVVAYDDTDHAGAARLWYLLRWLGHGRVRVLNGGLAAWTAAGFAVEKGEARPVRAPAEFRAGEPLVRLLDWREASLLVDARAPERYRGEVEPIDPVAGHIPGAKNLPYASLLAEGRFPPAGALREKLMSLGPKPTFYCGSGVTACVLLLAADEAELEASLYPGSWSEYCSLPGVVVERG